MWYHLIHYKCSCNEHFATTLNETRVQHLIFSTKNRSNFATFQCIASCGQKGHMNRLLTCVWQSTGQPALGACDLKNRPAVSKPCNARPCSVGQYFFLIRENCGICPFVYEVFWHMEPPYVYYKRFFKKNFTYILRIVGFYVLFFLVYGHRNRW